MGEKELWNVALVALNLCCCTFAATGFVGSTATAGQEDTHFGRSVYDHKSLTDHG